MNIRLFKHMEKKFSDELLKEGKVRINGLKYYQSTENECIKDLDEGVKLLTQFLNKDDFQVFKKEEHDEDYVDITNNKDHIPLISITKMDVSRIQVAFDAYTYCTSLSSEKDLFSDYDSCIEITDIHFFKLIGYELSKQKFSKTIIHDNRKFSGTAGKVVYRNERKVDHTEKHIPPYFLKDTSYKDENEYRVVYFSTINNTIDLLKPVDLVIPNLKKYCKKIW